MRLTPWLSGLSYRLAFSSRVAKHSRRRRSNVSVAAIEKLEDRTLLSTLGTIEGQKFVDTNANGNHDSGEAYSNGWTIELLDATGTVVSTTVTQDMDRDNSGTIDPATEAGWYQFNNLTPGPYVVREVSQSGWLQSTPGVVTELTLGQANDDFQSPVDIPASVAPVNLDNVIDLQFAPTVVDKLFNNGHTIEAVYPNTGNNNTLTVNGEEFELEQFHFHSLGEHLIDGHQTWMEMHLVYQHPDGGRAVVAVLIDINQNDTTTPNAAYAPVFDQMENLQNKDDEVALPTAIDASTLLPADRSGYFYQGSLTTPPATQEVTWFVLSTPVNLSFMQFTQYWAAATDSDISHNFLPGNRPVQPLNGRQFNQWNDEVTVADGQTVTQQDFGNYQNATISGRKFQDSNANGVRDSGEPYLNGWTIELKDAGNAVVATATTQDVDLDSSGTIDPETESGFYQFTDVKPGSYTIQEVLQTGWIQSTVTPTGPVTSGQTVTQQDFGNYQNGTIVGRKFHDLNANGVRDSGEPYLNGWTIELKDAGNTVVATATTQDVDVDSSGTIDPETESGWYLFTSVTPGSYTIDEVLPTAWAQSTGNHTVTVTSGQLAPPQDFGNFLTDAIGVYRNGTWDLDLNRDGQRETAEVGVWSYGTVGLTPVVGDWNGDGYDDPGLYSNGTWLLDLNGNGDPGDDATFVFNASGFPNLTPVVGDWDGNGADDVGLYSNGTWLLDVNGSRSVDSPDTSQVYGGFGLTPVVGDWNGDGDDDLGVYQPSTGIWATDVDENATLDGNDVIPFGLANFTPVVGDWNSDGNDDIGVYDSSSGFWARDINDNGQFDDGTTQFGSAGDVPVVGKWPASVSAIQLASSPVSSANGVARLTQAELQPIIETAAGAWADAGVSPIQVNRLKNITVSIADLGGSTLAITSPTGIVIDINAAGHGWFIDQTPSQNEEFSSGGDGELHGIGAADSRVDLLTVVEHEFGHVLGLPHDSAASVMNGLLSLGARRAVPVDLIDGAFSSDWYDFLLQ